MALAVLTLPPRHLVTSGSRVISGMQWRSLSDAQDVLAAAQEAVEVACSEAVTELTARHAEQARATERHLQQALLLKALSLQLEFERVRGQLESQFVQTLLTSLKTLLAGPLPASFFERAHDSARRWVGESAPLVLHVSAADETAAREGLNARDMPVTLQVDPNLSPGQCHLQTEFGRIHASLDSQLEALALALEHWWSAVPGKDPQVIAAAATPP